MCILETRAAVGNAALGSVRPGGPNGDWVRAARIVREPAGCAEAAKFALRLWHGQSYQWSNEWSGWTRQIFALGPAPAELVATQCSVWRVSTGDPSAQNRASQPIKRLTAQTGRNGSPGKRDGMFSAGKACGDASAVGRRILVVRLSSMGDIIHALPAVATMKHSLPGSMLTWVVHPRWMPLLEGNPFVDRVITLGSNLREGWRALRSERYDIAVDFQGLVRSALVGKLARPERLYGLHYSEARECLAALFYSDRVRTAGPHRVDRNLELARAAGASMILRKFSLPEGTPEPGLPNCGFVLACPIAGWAGKQWPLKHWGALAQRLRSELGLVLVLNGALGTEHLLASVPGAWQHTSRLPGLIHATRRATAVVGTDSGPVHLAAALGKPGVAIYGPTDPAQTGPYGTSFTVLREPSAGTTYRRHRRPHPSMWRVHADAVFEALKARISARTPTSA